MHDLDFSMPFAPAVHEAETLAVTAGEAVGDVAAAHAAALLRADAPLWHKLVAEPTVAGSFALELCVVVDLHNRGHVVLQADSGRSVMLQAQVVLVKQGVAPGTATTMAGALVKSLLEKNIVVARAARRVCQTAGALPGDPPGPVSALVCRVSVRPLQHLGGNGDTGTSWFRTTHANCLIVLPGHRALLGEPAAPAPCDNVRLAVAKVLGLAVDQVWPTRAETWAPIADLSLCTLGAAVLGLCMLKNLPKLSHPEALGELTAWVHGNQHWLLRLLLRAIVMQQGL